MVSLKLMEGAAIRMVVTSARTEAGRDSSIPSCMVVCKKCSRCYPLVGALPGWGPWGGPNAGRLPPLVGRSIVFGC